MDTCPTSRSPPARVEPDPVAVASGNQSVAIVLDLMDPSRPAGRALEA
jgi:hypothetical protein